MSVPLYAGTVPSRTQSQDNFNTNTQALLEYIGGVSSGDLVPEINTTASSINASKISVDASEAVVNAAEFSCLAVSNFIGLWSEQSGSQTVPAATYHDTEYWLLLRDIADITASEPGVSADWSRYSKAAGQNEFVATGEVTAGMAVGLRSDGTVEAITSTGTQFEVGSKTEASVVSATITSAVYDSTNESIVIAYNAGDGSGKAVVGTVSGTAISFGTPVSFNAGAVSEISSTHDSTNGKIVIAYTVSSNAYGAVIVGDVSGTSISFGAIYYFNSGVTIGVSTAYDSTNGKIVIAYQSTPDSDYGRAIVGTVSGTTISLGTPVSFSSAAISGKISAVYDSSNGKMVVAYKDVGGYGKAVVGTVSGTTISFGTPVDFKTATITYLSAAYDSSNGKIVIAYYSVDEGQAVVGTVSGTTISFGTPVVFYSGTASQMSTVYDSANGKVIISYADSDQSDYGTSRIGAISGTLISFGTPFVFNSDHTDYLSAAYDSSNGKVVLAYQGDSVTSYCVSTVVNIDSIVTNVGDMVGLADDSIANGVSGTVDTVAGENIKQSGLTTGSEYYVQYDGAVTTSPATDYDHIKVGRAVSATHLLVEEITLIGGLYEYS